MERLKARKWKDGRREDEKMEAEKLEKWKARR